MKKTMKKKQPESTWSEADRLWSHVKQHVDSRLGWKGSFQENVQRGMESQVRLFLREVPAELVRALLKESADLLHNHRP